MLKIGVVGLGDIAQKAYLPVLSKKELGIHLYTRDKVKLLDIGAKYRFSNYTIRWIPLLAPEFKLRLFIRLRQHMRRLWQTFEQQYPRVCRQAYYLSL